MVRSLVLLFLLPLALGQDNGFNLPDNGANLCKSIDSMMKMSSCMESVNVAIASCPAITSMVPNLSMVANLGSPSMELDKEQLALMKKNCENLPEGRRLLSSTTAYVSNVAQYFSSISSRSLLQQEEQVVSQAMFEEMCTGDCAADAIKSMSGGMSCIMSAMKEMMPEGYQPDVNELSDMMEAQVKIACAKNAKQERCGTHLARARHSDQCKEFLNMGCCATSVLEIESKLDPQAAGMSDVKPDCPFALPPACLVDGASATYDKVGFTIIIDPTKFTTEEEQAELAQSILQDLTKDGISLELAELKPVDGGFVVAVRTDEGKGADMQATLASAKLTATSDLAEMQNASSVSVDEVEVEKDEVVGEKVNVGRDPVETAGVAVASILGAVVATVGSLLLQ